MIVKKILCVCRGNICRSAMLEALLKRAVLNADKNRRSSDYNLNQCNLVNLIIESAGTYNGVSKDLTGSPANEQTMLCMQDIGIDIGEHKSKPISSININDYDLIVCMTPEEIGIIGMLRPRGLIMLADGGVTDPWRMGWEAYQECTRALEKVSANIMKTFFFA